MNNSSKILKCSYVIKISDGVQSHDHLNCPLHDHLAKELERAKNWDPGVPSWIKQDVRRVPPDSSTDTAQEEGEGEKTQFVTRWRVRLEFKPQDLWIGVFWKKGAERGFDEDHINIWICILPMLPIHIKRYRFYFTSGEKP